MSAHPRHDAAAYKLRTWPPSADGRAGRRLRKGPFAAALAAVLIASAGPAAAWGDQGHMITAMIAYRHLTPKARAAADRLLQQDRDTLSGTDFASRATWADKWKYSDNHGPRYRHTSQWHFTDLELDANGQDLDAACFHHPGIQGPATGGPDKECAVDKIEQFKTELASKQTPQAERILAFKYLLHLVGDIHQPLHSSDSHDAGGNCQTVSWGGRSMKLHAYWDGEVLSDFFADLPGAAAQLDGRITAQNVADWSRGTAADWAVEVYGAAASIAYTPALRAACQGGRPVGTVAIGADYDRTARGQARIQLQKGGIRLAKVLNDALGAWTP